MMSIFHFFSKRTKRSTMKKNSSIKESTPVTSLRTRDGNKVNMPYEGSLGLLALGDVGLILWRNKKEENQ